jgi:hypothetical protein
VSGNWERNPVDVLVATMISGAETVFHEFSENLKNMWANLPPGLKVAVAKFPEPVIDISRNKAAQVALNSGARWLWFLDSDILPPVDALKRLIEADKPIVGGLYVRRHNPPFNEMLRLRPEGGLRPINDGEYVPGSLVECDAVATGCLLIRTEVFEKMRPHQLMIDGRPSVGLPSWFLWTESRVQPGFSEDFDFCVWAKQQGIPIFCHTAVRCEHMGPVRFYPTGNGQLGFRFPGEPRV